MPQIQPEIGSASPAAQNWLMVFNLYHRTPIYCFLSGLKDFICQAIFVEYGVCTLIAQQQRAVAQRGLGSHKKWI